MYLLILLQHVLTVVLLRNQQMERLQLSIVVVDKVITTIKTQEQ